MWSSDFKGRSEKLEREQRQRLERDRLKAEKERAEKERFAQKVRQHEEEVSRRRAAALAAEEIVSLNLFQTSYSQFFSLQACHCIASRADTRS